MKGRADMSTCVNVASNKAASCQFPNEQHPLHLHRICTISVTGWEYDYLNAVWDRNSPKIKLFQCTAKPRATG